MSLQDPSLFSGTIRSNFDPLDEYDDESLYSAWQRSGSCADSSSHSLDSSTRAHVQDLDQFVMESGSNFSVGQRQQLGIAWTLLRKTKIVIVDEGTASIDAAMDATIRSLRPNVHPSLVSRWLTGPTRSCIATLFWSWTRGESQNSILQPGATGGVVS
jgi:ABC-type multidrug transport system fused ATPase/permease subunit